MKRRVTLSIVLAAILISLSLTSSDFTASAQRPSRFTADTGVITLGPNQILRMTVVNRGKADSKVGFRKMAYTQGSCSSGVCVHAVASQTTSDPLTLAPGEAASIDIANTSFGVRGVAVMDYPDDSVVAQIIDTTTGGIVAFLIDDTPLN